MTEPTPRRDPGPYRTSDQARAQFEAITYGIPGDRERLAVMAICEALAIARVGLTEYERDALAELADLVGPETCQVIAGWVLRAYVGAVERDSPATAGRGHTFGHPGTVGAAAGRSAGRRVEP